MYRGSEALSGELFYIWESLLGWRREGENAAAWETVENVSGDGLFLCRVRTYVGALEIGFRSRGKSLEVHFC